MTTHPRRVLVIEDESAQRLMYARALGQIGFEQDCVGSIGEAVAALEDREYAIALLDLNLSGENGLDLFELIRERYPAMSVVIATGYGTYEIAQKAIHMDVVDFLAKPVGLEQLSSALQRAWDRHVLVQSPVEQLRNPGAPDGSSEGLDASIAQRENLNIDSVERDLILEALRRCKDNRKAAAHMLGISERKLYYRLTQYNLK